jgi:hypothetical protein
VVVGVVDRGTETTHPLRGIYPVTLADCKMKHFKSYPNAAVYAINKNKEAQKGNYSIVNKTLELLEKEKAKKGNDK